MEQEIEKILSSIEHKDLSDIKSFEEIKFIRKKVLKDIFEDFIEYPKNQENYPIFEKMLDEDECMYITEPELIKDDMIYFVDFFVFYNIKFRKARYISSSEDSILIHMDEEQNYRRIKIDSVLFKILSDEDKAKISLVELLNKQN